MTHYGTIGEYLLEDEPFAGYLEIIGAHFIANDVTDDNKKKTILLTIIWVKA